MKGAEMSVIVGVDGSAGSRAAIRLAAQEARYRDGKLIAVMAYTEDRALGAPAARPLATLRTTDDERTIVESSLREAVEEALGDQARDVDMRVVVGLAGRRLVDAAKETSAALLVLAARGSMSLFLGTVSQYVLRNAPCPVLVVPDASKDL
jgi:nucleotide-binding universal stress UspA family protein